jgi:hypothetical protein
VNIDLDPHLPSFSCLISFRALPNLDDLSILSIGMTGPSHRRLKHIHASFFLGKSFTLSHHDLGDNRLPWFTWYLLDLHTDAYEYSLTEACNLSVAHSLTNDFQTSFDVHLVLSKLTITNIFTLTRLSIGIGFVSSHVFYSSSLTQLLSI